ncbi:MAG: dihydrofolate reductase family protein [Actinomycetota bacterium]
MIRLLSLPGDREIGDLVEYCLDSHRPGGRRLILNMVTSLDGATSVGGETAPLSDEDDRALFNALRAAADVILVGAETVRAEGYGPVSLPERARRARTDRGLEESPRLAVVTRSVDLGDGLRRLRDGSGPPYVITGRDAPPDRVQEAGEGAVLLQVGESGADPAALLDALWERGHEVILCEGGPTLAGRLAAGDLIDEVNLALSPLVVGGSSSRLVHGLGPASHRFRLDRLMTGDRMLFARYLRDRP